MGKCLAPMGFSHVLRSLELAGRRCRCWGWHCELLIVHHHWQHSRRCACSRSKVPIAPMGFSHVLRVCSQGGGVAVSGGTVSFSSCTITGNTAVNVRAHAQNFPSPDGKIADALALILACTSANDASINYRLCVPQRLQKLPSPRWESVLLTCPFRFSSLMTGAALIYQYPVRAICA